MITDQNVLVQIVGELSRDKKLFLPILDIIKRLTDQNALTLVAFQMW